MADAWGGAWGVAWGVSWGAGVTPPVTPPAVRGGRPRRRARQFFDPPKKVEVARPSREYAYGAALAVEVGGAATTSFEPNMTRRQTLRDEQALTQLGVL